MARSKAQIEQDKKILADYESEKSLGLSESETKMRVAIRHGVSAVTVWRAIKRAKEAQI